MLAIRGGLRRWLARGAPLLLLADQGRQLLDNIPLDALGVFGGVAAGDPLLHGPHPAADSGERVRPFLSQILANVELAQRLGGYAGLAMVGTPAMIADEMEAWLAAEACDGFNVMFPYLPGGLEAFVDRVVPELQRRGLFRTEYEGRTLRANLGLPRPANRFFSGGA